MDSTLHHDPFFPDDALEREPWEQQLSGEPVLDYDKGNAKNIIVFLNEAPLEIVQRVLVYEREHENRVTVVDAAASRVQVLEAEETAAESMPVRHFENPETVALVRETLGLPEPDINDNEAGGDA